MHTDARKELDIQISRAAYEQIKLIMAHDYTLEGLFFRLKIGGKGCDGFTYETGFSEKQDDDILYNHQDLTILLDPFTAHYAAQGHLDYLLNTQTHEDGFIFVNANEDKHQGKFFKDAPPPIHLDKELKSQTGGHEI